MWGTCKIVNFSWLLFSTLVIGQNLITKKITLSKWSVNAFYCVNGLHVGLCNKMHLHSTLKRCFFVLKDFDQLQVLKTIAKKSVQFYMTVYYVPHIGFLCYSNGDQILLYGRCLESKDEYMYCFMKFC